MSTPSPVDAALASLLDNLPRQGPGSDATTRRLLSLAGVHTIRPRILDLGCGTGRAALALAAETGADVVGVDVHQPFLDVLTAAARERGLADRVSTLNCSMDALPYRDRSIDLIWCEGAVYTIGFDNALRVWRRLLAPAGVVVVSEIEWTTDTPSGPAREYWADQYPLRTAAENIHAAERAGYRVAARHPIPDGDWWDEYYTPIEERLRVADTSRPGMREAIAIMREEVRQRRDHGAEYDYVGYILRPLDADPV